MSVLARLDAVVLQFLVECRCWVISGQTAADQSRPLSVLVGGLNGSTQHFILEGQDGV